ncbi:short-chain dehydrogenase [Candidatus Marinamargulisbacteria bacterium SCGC AG-414-C22]|nr:short-chain dehydrogenase [Candidatus Marinamargulisbacteria bacterium SCGC AG-414-C22]
MLTIWVTGSNRGIGLELTRQYLATGNRVIAICRTVSPELAETQATIIEGLDVTQPKTYHKLTPYLEQYPVDIWINNAGILCNEIVTELNDKASTQILNQFHVNALGPLQLIGFMYDYMKPSSKCAVISSRMGSIADNSSGGRYGYRMSKAALNACAQSLAIDLKPKGVIVSIIHPGWVKTEMTNHSGHVTAAESAYNIIQRIKESKIENTGTFWHADGTKLPW